MQKHIAYSIIRLLYFGVLAQLEERYTGSVEVRSSSLLCSTTVRPKTQFSDGYFIPFIQNSPIQSPKSRKKEGFPPQISAISLIFGIAIDELLNAAAEGDGSSDVVAQRREREFGGDLFFASAKEMTAVVVVLDGAEGMLAGLLAELLPSNIPPDEHHDALFGAL